VDTKNAKNGAKTWKIWGKQDWKDLYAIIYRFQGLAREICKTHQIVLANRSKDRVRSEKGFGMDLFARNLKITGFIKKIYKTQIWI
jgi:hypothetical protein